MCLWDFPTPIPFLKSVSLFWHFFDYVITAHAVGYDVISHPVIRNQSYRVDKSGTDVLIYLVLEKLWPLRFALISYFRPMLRKFCCRLYPQSPWPVPSEVSKSWGKFGIIQKNDLKVRHFPNNPIFFENFSWKNDLKFRHYPRNSKFFWKIYLNILSNDMVPTISYDIVLKDGPYHICSYHYCPLLSISLLFI